MRCLAYTVAPHLAPRLQGVSLSAQANLAEGKNPTTNNNLDRPDDQPTQVLFEFLKDVLMKGRLF